MENKRDHIKEKMVSEFSAFRRGIRSHIKSYKVWNSVEANTVWIVNTDIWDRLDWIDIDDREFARQLGIVE